jgi:hypothetical protein
VLFFCSPYHDLSVSKGFSVPMNLSIKTVVRHPVCFSSHTTPVDTQPLEDFLKRGLGPDRFSQLKLRVSQFSGRIKLVSGLIRSTKFPLSPEQVKALSKAWEDVLALTDDSGKPLAEKWQDNCVDITIQGRTYSLFHPMPVHWHPKGTVLP